MAKNIINRLLFLGLVVFFVLAGMNHFRDPEFYIPLIPDYLPYKNAINIISGIVEITLGLTLLSVRYRRIVSYLLIFLMILFIPSHIWFIEIGGCIEGGLCVPAWVGWVRLLIIHPLLILWIWYSGQYRRPAWNS